MKGAVFMVKGIKHSVSADGWTTSFETKQKMLFDLGSWDSEFKDKTVHFYVLNSVLSALLRGEINWENLYIGYGAEIETTPKDTNARAVIRWMAMYGYVYQRNINAR